MGKKKRNSNDLQNHKSLSIDVIVEDLSSHPLCFHGPTLLFSNEKGKFYACSACRNKRDCTIHISEEDWQKKIVQERNKKYCSMIPKIDKNCLWTTLKVVKSAAPSDRAYCFTCQELYTTNANKHSKDHIIITTLSDDQLSHPTTWLPPLDNDEVEAQYLFSRKCIATILAALKKNNIRNVLCIGTPSIHEEISSRIDFKSLLLDYDKRHAQFQSPDKFIWYNMFNNFLFNGEDDDLLLKKFLKESSNSGLSIVMDPPFGGRVEPLMQTLQSLSELHKNICGGTTSDLLPVIWVFPYFSEPYICNMAPEIKMHDYQVEYENHKKFQNRSKQGRKFGSPVRLFTNLPLSSIDLSNDDRYKWCEICQLWVSRSNAHCGQCGRCASKSGVTYRHCAECKRCVKPTYTHCARCGRCCQAQGHVCGLVVEVKSCYHCKESGHKRSECPQLKNAGMTCKKRKTED